MANNKVQLADGSVLIDLTSDTVTAAALRSGYTAHDAAGNVVNGALEVDPVYSVTKSLTNVTTSNDDTKVLAGNSFHMDLSANTGLVLNRVQVIMGGVDITDQAFSPFRDYYSITSVLTGISSSNDDFEVIAGNSFHMDLTPDSGKIINSVTVMMGGVDVTSQVFTPGTEEK